jgi:C_GCAxxG_C_C family probable redox protein
MKDVRMSEEEILNEAERKAYKYELAQAGCSSSVLLAIQEVFGLMDEPVLKAASGLAGGIGGTHSACGALTGGVMALGLKYGWGFKEIEGLLKESKDDTRSLTVFMLSRKLSERFIEEYGSTLCHDIQIRFFGRIFSSLNPEDAEEFERLGGHREIDGKPAVCPSVAGKAARWVAELVLEEEGERPSNI